MTINWMNLFRARSFGKGIGVFSSLGRNKLFLGVSIAILIMNVLIVQFGGTIFGTEGLNFTQWTEVGILSLIVIGISSLINKIFK
jgi:Ca2+-transporting ATPase